MKVKKIIGLVFIALIICFIILVKYQHVDETFSLESIKNANTTLGIYLNKKNYTWNKISLEPGVYLPLLFIGLLTLLPLLARRRIK